MITLTCFRVAAWDTPLWALPNRRAGRFNGPGTFTVQYLSLHPLTPWAEVMRAEAITDSSAANLLRPPIWAVRVRLDDPPLELTFDSAPQHGLEAEALVGDDHGPCRAFAARLGEAGRHDAFTAPSAALPGTRNLVLLGPKVAIPYLADPIDASDVPVGVVALEGRAPEGLLGLVHHRDARTDHPELAAWRKGQEFALREPLIDATAAVIQDSP